MLAGTYGNKSAFAICLLEVSLELQSFLRRCFTMTVMTWWCLTMPCAMPPGDLEVWGKAASLLAPPGKPNCKRQPITLPEGLTSFDSGPDGQPVGYVMWRRALLWQGKLPDRRLVLRAGHHQQSMKCDLSLSVIA